MHILCQVGNPILTYSRSSRKRPPREFEKVVVTRAGCLREWAVVRDHALKQYRLATYEMYESDCAGHAFTDIENLSY